MIINSSSDDEFNTRTSSDDV